MGVSWYWSLYFPTLHAWDGSVVIGLWCTFDSSSLLYWCHLKRLRAIFHDHLVACPGFPWEPHWCCWRALLGVSWGTSSEWIGWDVSSGGPRRKSFHPVLCWHVWMKFTFFPYHFFFVVKCRYCLNVSSFSPLPFGAETSNISLLYFGFCPCLFYYFQVPTLFRSASMIGNGKNAWETHAMPHLGFRGLWTAYCIHCWSLLACLIYKHLGLFFLYLEY